MVRQSARSSARLREERKTRGLSQERLASRVRLARPTIGKIENGQLDVSLDNALELCEALGVRLVDLLDEDVQVGSHLLTPPEVRSRRLGASDPFMTATTAAKAAAEAAWPLIEEARYEARKEMAVMLALLWNSRQHGAIAAVTGFLREVNKLVEDGERRREVLRHLEDGSANGPPHGI